MNLIKKNDGKNWIRAFVRGYVEAMIWADLQDENGEPLDHAYDATDIAHADRKSIIRDCLDFLRNGGERLIDLDATPDSDTLDETYSRAGHDFWLTRNRHGAGFWDGDWPKNGNKLTDLCRPYGEAYVYIGDDERIHVS